MKKLFEELRGKLIVSCQARKDEPLYNPLVMSRMALAAEVGGAAAIRAEGVNDIKSIRKMTHLPIIGLRKNKYKDSDIYITPTKAEIEELLTTPCEVIALDMTDRERPYRQTSASLIKEIHKFDRLALADVSTYEEGIAAVRNGADAVSTTMSGYTPYSPQQEAPDFTLVGRLAAALDVPVFAEGRISTPEDAKKMIAIGAWAVVVGTAITRPQVITSRFVKAMGQ